ncbi:putative holin-like toxin [Bacillus velezensis]|nr:putative holin-like toxin [Bacillus velezensis]MEC2150810.1 putative holin-like toxin [Bacillus velezensis]
MTVYQTMMIMINFCGLMLNAVGLFVLIGNSKQT